MDSEVLYQVISYSGTKKDILKVLFDYVALVEIRFNAWHVLLTPAATLLFSEMIVILLYFELRCLFNVSEL